MRIIGYFLIIVGVAVLINKGISYKKTTRLLDLDSVQASVRHTKHIALEPFVGVFAVAGGILIILFGSKPNEA